ncbi:MAG TPA: response regulator transcription factor [Candidatus Dormibacteraeota bacterium]
MGGYTAPGRHRIAVADDHIDLRELLALRFSMVESLEVVGQAANGVEAIGLARDRQPDVMTLDLEMPVMGGAEAIPVLRAVAPSMRIVVFSGQPSVADLTRGNLPDAVVSKGANLADLVAVVVGLLAEGAPPDLVEVDLGNFPVHVALDAFDSWVGLNARVRQALATKGDFSAELLGDIPLEPSDLLCLMGVFMQLGLPLMAASQKGLATVDVKFVVRRDSGAAARRALLALGGNGTLRAFNKVWSHNPTREAERALDLVDARLVDCLPAS